MAIHNKRAGFGVAAVLALAAGLAACGGGASDDHGPAVDETPAEALDADQRRVASGQSTTNLDPIAAERAQGFERAPGLRDRVAPILRGEEDRWTVTLKAGVVYRIVAACDDNCSDVDLFLEDAEGNVVDSDALMNGHPVVDITPEAEARYTIRTRVYSCSVAACYAATRVLKQ